MSDESQSFLKLSEEMLDDARMLLTQNRRRSAVSRAYYAVFDAAKAALLRVGSSPKTHAGVLSEFGQKLVNTGLVGKGSAKILRNLLELRQESDYSTTYVASEQEAEEAIKECAEFIEEIKSVLEKLEKK